MLLRVPPASIDARAALGHCFPNRSDFNDLAAVRAGQGCVAELEAFKIVFGAVLGFSGFLYRADQLAHSSLKTGFEPAAVQRGAAMPGFCK